MAKKSTNAAPKAPKAKAPELTPEQLKAKQLLAEARAQYNTAMGKPPKTLGGFTGDEIVTVVSADGVGFKNAEQKAIAQVIDGKPLSQVVMTPRVTWGWVRQRLMLGTIKLDGMTVVEAYARAATAEE